MDGAHPAIPYRTYWLAWLVLLVLTLVMVGVGSPPVLVGGVVVKAAIIALWFMHLRWERIDFVLGILLGIFATGLVLYALIAPDARGPLA